MLFLLSVVDVLSLGAVLHTLLTSPRTTDLMLTFLYWFAIVLLTGSVLLWIIIGVMAVYSLRTRAEIGRY
jgi:hypothetical protein